MVLRVLKAGPVMYSKGESILKRYFNWRIVLVFSQNNSEWSRLNICIFFSQVAAPLNGLSRL